MTLGIEIEGGRQLRRALKDAEADLGDLKDVHARAARIVSNRAAQLAPKRTGRLARSTRPAATRTTAAVRIGNARVPYAKPIHWGWAARNIEPSLFATRALTQTRTQWEPAYFAELEAIVSKIESRTT